jgi:hypothetical protein
MCIHTSFKIFAISGHVEETRVLVVLRIVHIDMNMPVLIVNFYREEQSSREQQRTGTWSGESRHNDSTVQRHELEYKCITEETM